MNRFICVSILLSLSACVTGKRNSSPKNPVKLQPKAGQSANEETTTAEQDQAPNAKSNAKLVDFIKRMSQMNPDEVQAEDHNLIAETMQKLSPNQIERGFLTAAALRLTSMRKEQSRQYEELDLFSGSKSSPANPGSSPLEKLSSEYRVNVLEELKTNPTLQSAGIFLMALKASQGETPEFKKALSLLGQDKIKEWKTFSASLTSFDKTAHQGGGVVLESENDVADLRLADLALVEATRLAGIKKYKEAVKLAEAISEKNPMYNSSREKIRIFSDQAVMDLRRKAALAFQNAIPVNDSKIKQSYLKEAKTYLETALNQYPDSKKLDKIKENLSVISRDLRNLEEEGK